MCRIDARSTGAVVAVGRLLALALERHGRSGWVLALPKLGRAVPISYGGWDNVGNTIIRCSGTLAFALAMSH